MSRKAVCVHALKCVTTSCKVSQPEIVCLKFARWTVKKWQQLQCATARLFYLKCLVEQSLHHEIMQARRMQFKEDTNTLAIVIYCRRPNGPHRDVGQSGPMCHWQQQSHLSKNKLVASQFPFLPKVFAVCRAVPVCEHILLRALAGMWGYKKKYQDGL